MATTDAIPFGRRSDRTEHDALAYIAEHAERTLVLVRTDDEDVTTGDLYAVSTDHLPQFVAARVGTDDEGFTTTVTTY